MESKREESWGRKSASQPRIGKGFLSASLSAGQRGVDGPKASPTQVSRASAPSTFRLRVPRKRGQVPKMRSTRWAIWFLVPAPFSAR